MNGHKIINQNGLYFITPTVVGWVDAFSRRKYKDVIIDSLRYCVENKGLVINAYVIMSNHLHLICHAKDSYQLSDILRDFKTHTSKKIIKTILEDKEESRQEWMLRLFKYYAKYNSNNTTYQFWKLDNMPIELQSPKWILARLDYIHNNPVKAGYVIEAEHYIYSSATNYKNGKGLLDIELIDLGSIEGYVFT